jgi:hypothetical protein
MQLLYQEDSYTTWVSLYISNTLKVESVLNSAYNFGHALKEDTSHIQHKQKLVNVGEGSKWNPYRLWAKCLVNWLHCEGSFLNSW